MNQFNLLKEDKIKPMFFILKILALFFCSVPLFEYFFQGESQKALIRAKTSFTLVIVFVVLLVLTFFWMFMDNKRTRYKGVLALEIFIFFSVCATSIYFSGAISSYYKFVFIFMIVLYTIELGMKVGLLIASAASIVLLSTDFLWYDKPGVNPYFENDLAMCAMFIVVAWVLGYYVRLANLQILKLTDYANIDGLTGVYNHRFFYDALKEACEESVETKKPLSLIMLDIDYFKIYNDMFGHQQGDTALKELADILKAFMRTDDIISRYGGEEFTIILKNTDIDRALGIANKLRKCVADHAFYGQEHLPNENFTVSMGVAQLADSNESYTQLVKRADLALYRAKYLRRNSVEVYTSIFEEFSHLGEDGQAIKETIQSLKTLITVINSRDSYTFSHIERVVHLCSVIADYMELSPNDKRRLCYAAYMHDLGKINIPKEVLISEKNLSPGDWEDLKRHPVDSANIISKVGGLEDVVPIVRQHHERYDGEGYPDRLKGNEIEYLARILTLADSFDAMTNTRPYQKTKTYIEAFEEIEKCSGTQFDPELSKIFIKAIKEKGGEYLHVAM